MRIFVTVKPRKKEEKVKKIQLVSGQSSRKKIIDVVR